MNQYFSKTIKIGNKFIGENRPAFFIADIGANFDNSLEKAKRLALAAKEAGADVVKFQTFKAKKIVSGKGFSSMKLKGIHGSWSKPVDQVFREAQFPREWHKDLDIYCKKIGAIFTSSAYDYESIDLLESLGVPFYKIGSGDITWHEILDYTAKKGKPVILSTGASTLAEVAEAVQVIMDTGNRNLVLLQCITNYPSKIESANINVLKTYQNTFGTIVGYSDHSPGDVVVSGAVAVGAKVIEKHFTLDKTDSGPDHPHSMNPAEFKEMVERVRALEAAMGSSHKTVVAEEAETVIVQRRGLYLKRSLKKGQIIKQADIIELRPALGILPKFKNIIIGSVVKKDLEANRPIFWEDLA